MRPREMSLQWCAWRYRICARARGQCVSCVWCLRCVSLVPTSRLARACVCARVRSVPYEVCECVVVSVCLQCDVACIVLQLILVSSVSLEGSGKWRRDQGDTSRGAPKVFETLIYVYTGHDVVPA